MQSNQIYLSVLKTAIKKALAKNLPQILDDAVQYLESHDIQVKQRKKRSKSKPLQNIDDLQKKTQSASAKKIKSTPFFNLNTNRIVSNKIGTKYPRMKFGNIKQDDKIVWVCGTPGHLKNTLATLKQSDEKTEPIFDPILEEPEDDQLSEEESIAQDEEQLLSEEESITLDEEQLSEEQEEPIALNEGEDENSIENSHLDEQLNIFEEQLSEKNIFDFEGQSSEENIFDFAEESSLNEVLQLSENSVDNLELELKPQKSKKLKRRRKKKKSKNTPAPPTSPSPQPPMPPSIRDEFTPINIFLED